MLAISTIGCTSKTEFGECIGLTEDKNPKLEYKYNTLNLILALVFVETLVVPAVVILEELQCPIGEKK